MDKLLFLILNQYIPLLELKVLADLRGRTKSDAFRIFRSTFQLECNSELHTVVFFDVDRWICSCERFVASPYHLCPHLCRWSVVPTSPLAMQLHLTAPYLGPCRRPDEATPMPVEDAVGGTVQHDMQFFDEAVDGNATPLGRRLEAFVNFLDFLRTLVNAELVETTNGHQRVEGILRLGEPFMNSFLRSFSRMNNGRLPRLGDLDSFNMYSDLE